MTYDVEDGQCLLFPLEPEEAKIYEFIPVKPSRERHLGRAAKGLRASLKKKGLSS